MRFEYTVMKVQVSRGTEVKVGDKADAMISLHETQGSRGGVSKFELPTATLPFSPRCQSMQTSTSIIEYTRV